MKWLLKFRRKDAPEGEGCVCTVVRCSEDELMGVQKATVMELECNSPGPWICIDAVPMKSREDHHDD